MIDVLNIEIKGLPPVEGDEARSAILISDALDMIHKGGFETIRDKGGRVEIEFFAKAASGFSDPLKLITGITMALEKARAYASGTAIRDLSFVRKAGDETKYTIQVSAQRTK